MSRTGRPRKLCLTCHVEHVQKTPALVRGLRKAGLSKKEINEIFDQIESRTEINSRQSMFEQNDAILAGYASSGVVSPKEIAHFKALLEARHPDPSLEPDDPMHVPDAFRNGVEGNLDPAIAQARKERVERERKARFARAHPNKNAEYQRRHRERTQKKEDPE